MAILDSYITENSIGTPEANIEFINLDRRTIVSFEVEFTCYDSYGNVTTDFPILYDGSLTGYTDRESIEYLDLPCYSWALYSNERTSSIGNIKLKKVAFSDGTIWYR